MEILRLSQFCKQLGWDVEVLATDPVFLEAARRDGVNAVELDVIWRPIRPVRDVWGLLRLWRFLCAQPYTIVHTHTTKAGFVGRIAARLAGVPIVVHTAHGFAFHEASGIRKIAFYTVLERIASWACDAVVTVSRFHADWGKRLGIADVDKIVPIPNGIASLPPPTAGDRERLRRELGIAEGQLVLFTPGRLAAEKGLEDLISALAHLRIHWGNRLITWIAGEGPLRHDLQRRARENGLTSQVRFLGFRSDIASLLNASDIVVLPTWREGLSIALLEAMAAERPIVTTSIGPNLEATQNGECAVLVPPANPRELAKAISRLATEAPLRQMLAANAAARYRRHYTEDCMIGGYHRLYLELLRRNEPALAEQMGLASASLARLAEAVAGGSAREHQPPPQPQKEKESAESVSTL